MEIKLAGHPGDGNGGLGRAMPTPARNRVHPSRNLSMNAS
jgi:hypothetical protein